jgi:hypothetical protein
MPLDDPVYTNKAQLDMEGEDIMIEVFEEQVGGSGDNPSIAVHNQQGHDIVFRFKKTTPLVTVMDICCSM